MTISGEEISRVANLLKLRPRGMSIAAIAKELHMNRNSVAKYLDLLTANGAVELTRVGPAKLYFTAPRIPVSGMINLSSDYFVMLDANLRVLYVNNNVLAFEDRTRPEILQKRLDDLSFALVADEAIGNYLHTPERDEIFQRDVEVRKGGKTFHFHVKIISTVYENGTPGITILATDITTEKEQEVALLKREAEYRGVVEDQTELICRFLPDGTHSFVNEAYCRYFGKKRDDLISHRFYPRIPEDDRKKVAALLTSLTRENPVGAIEHRIIMPDGEVRWQRWIDRAIYSSDGRLVEYQSVGRDTTARRKAQDLARAQFQSFPVPTYIWRKKGSDLVLSEYNDAAYRITRGMIPGQVGRTARDIYRDYPSVLALLQRCSKEKATIDEDIHYTFLTTGEVKDLLVRCAYLPPSSILVYTIDITDRKKAENQLRERVKELTVLYRISQLMESAEGQLPEILTAIAGLLPAAMQFSDLAVARIRMDGRDYASGPMAETPWRMAHEIQVCDRPAGDLAITYSSRPPLPDDPPFSPEEAALVAAVAERIGRIAERFRALEALKEQVYRMRELLDRIPMPVYVRDTNGVYLGVNRAFEEFSGRSRTDLMGHHARDVWPPDLADHYDTIARQVITSGKIHVEEFVLPTVGGPDRRGIFTRAPFYGKDGTIRGIVATIQDITTQNHRT